MEPVFEIKDVSYSYPDKKALSHINISVYQGDFLAIVGPNGSGKSTLLKLILGILNLQDGSILMNGTDIRKLKNRTGIGYVSQNQMQGIQVSRQMFLKL